MSLLSFALWVSLALSTWPSHACSTSPPRLLELLLRGTNAPQCQPIRELGGEKFLMAASVPNRLQHPGSITPVYLPFISYSTFSRVGPKAVVQAKYARKPRLPLQVLLLYVITNCLTYTSSSDSLPKPTRGIFGHHANLSLIYNWPFTVHRPFPKPSLKQLRMLYDSLWWILYWSSRS